ncbi:MAG: hypothetical protein K5652_00435 [Bacteroidales bacterium]|nr:hypothetical protein [Bacteroidales bacterium]
MRKYGHIISTFLLAVFLTALLLSAFHTHPAHIEEPRCEQCEHHIPHPGHIAAVESGISDCLLCHFLGLPFVLALSALVLPPAMLLSGLAPRPQWAAVSSHIRHTRSRAPPVLFFA